MLLHLVDTHWSSTRFFNVSTIDTARFRMLWIWAAIFTQVFHHRRTLLDLHTCLVMRSTGTTAQTDDFACPRHKPQSFPYHYLHVAVETRNFLTSFSMLTEILISILHVLLRVLTWTAIFCTRFCCRRKLLMQQICSHVVDGDCCFRTFFSTSWNALLFPYTHLIIEKKTALFTRFIAHCWREPLFLHRNFHVDDNCHVHTFFRMLLQKLLFSHEYLTIDESRKIRTLFHVVDGNRYFHMFFRLLSTKRVSFTRFLPIINDSCNLSQAALHSRRTKITGLTTMK